MSAEPLVSALMPLHDHRDYVAEAIESVLAQTHPNVELIVVDDGSTDGGAEVARSFGPPVRVVTQSHSGEAVARNRAVSLASGDYMAFLDSDDLWDPRKLEIQLAALASDPQIDLVFAHEHRFRSPELGPDAPRFAGEEQTAPAKNWGTLLISRANLDRVGAFSTRWRFGSLLEWLTRAGDLGLREVMLPDVVLHRRMHPGSHTVLDRSHSTDYVRILKRSLDRRREAAGG